MPSGLHNCSKVVKTLHTLEMTIDEGLRLNLKGTSKAQREWNKRETSSFIVESEIRGRDEEKEEIVRLLLSCEATQREELWCILIVGMGGLGKTTLAQLACNDVRVKQHFDVGVWVSVSDPFDAKNIMVSIIEAVSKDICSCSNMDALHSAVWGLLHSKSYLIVLDDVWTEDQDDWDKLKPLFRGCNGSKILITTRSRKVALMMDSPTFPYDLKGLSDHVCWSLFMQRAFQRGEEEKHPTLLPIGQQIVRKCGGVALAAKTLGSLMRFKREVTEWLFVRDSELWKLDEVGSGIMPALRLSYFNLPPQLKACFSFCSIFPRSYDIKKEKLIHLWMAQGLIESREGSRLPEDIGNDYFNDLLWMSFFQEIEQRDQGVNGTGYKMHDAVYELAQFAAGSEYTILDRGLPAPVNFTWIRHSSVVCDFKSSMFPDELYKAKRLRTLLLYSAGNFRDIECRKIYANFRYLQALGLTGCGLQTLESIQNLSCLKYLDLSHTPVQVLPPDIGRLQLLQTLNLFNCYLLEELPDLAKMRNLRHLNNAGCEALTGIFPSRHFYRHKSADDQYQLQTLPLVVVGGNPDIRLLGLFNLRGTLKITHLKNLHTADVAGEAKLREKGGIESLGLHWGSDDNSEKTSPSEESMLTRFQMKRQANSSNPRTKRDIKSSASGISCDILLCEQVLEHLQPNQNLRRLLINGYPGKRFPHWDVPYLNVVHLISCKNSEHLPTLGNLRFLNTLSLREMHGVRHIGEEFYGQGIQSPFPSLKELILIDFPGLEEWSSPYGGEAFPGLKKLTVSNCPQLNVMPVIMSLEYLELRDCSANLIHYFQSLTCLQTLVVDKVRDLIYFSGEFPGKNSLLTSLGINSCPKLHLLPSELGNLTALRSLAIRWCEDLASLPQSLQNLNALESLEIGDCNSLLSLPDIEIGRLSNIRTLSIENCNNLSSLTMGFQYLTSLENLTIMYCPSLGLLPEGVEYLSALCSLTIISCPKFKTLPDGLQKLTTMHSLEIGSCPGLKALPEWIEKLASLRSLVLSDCQNVTVLPEGVKCLAALQHLSIQDCPQLLERCREHGGEDWPKIAHVPYKRIGLSQQSDPSAGSSSSSI